MSLHTPPPASAWISTHGWLMLFAFGVSTSLGIIVARYQRQVARSSLCRKVLGFLGLSPKWITHAWVDTHLYIQLVSFCASALGVVCVLGHVLTTHHLSVQRNQDTDSVGTLVRQVFFGSVHSVLGTCCFAFSAFVIPWFGLPEPDIPPQDRARQLRLHSITGRANWALSLVVAITGVWGKGRREVLVWGGMMMMLYAILEKRRQKPKKRATK